MGKLRFLFSQEAAKEFQLPGVGLPGDQLSEVFDVEPSDVNLHGTGPSFVPAFRGVSGGA
jgi:hypothetical protein